MTTPIRYSAGTLYRQRVVIAVGSKTKTREYAAGVGRGINLQAEHGCGERCIPVANISCRHEVFVLRLATNVPLFWFAPSRPFSTLIFVSPTTSDSA